MSTNTDISELFHHIMQSEEKIKQRFEALKQVNIAIQTAQDELRSTRYESNIINGKISTLSHKLVQEKIQKTWLESCEEILKVQHSDCSNENDVFREEVVEKKRQFIEKRTSFLSEMDAFVLDQWNVSIRVCEEHHQDYCQEENEKILQNQEITKRKLKEYEDEVLQKDKLEKELIVVLGTVEKKFQKCEELKSALGDEEDQIKLMNSTKHGLAKRISTDEEFQCVLRDLEHYKKCCTIAKYKHQELTKQLSSLPLRQKGYMSRGNLWHVGDRSTGTGTSLSEAPSGSSREFGSLSHYMPRKDRGKKLFQYKAVTEIDVVDEGIRVDFIDAEEMLVCVDDMSDKINGDL